MSKVVFGLHVGVVDTTFVEDNIGYLEVNIL